MGIPTVFIRLTGCPLRCSYCDTAYAFSGGDKMSLDAILAEVAKYCTLFVTVTGGEPLAQPGCLALMSRLLDEGYCVSLETSGAIDLSGIDPRTVKVMDLKTPSSGEEAKNLWSNLDHLLPHDQVKFVIGTNEDYEWSKRILAEYRLNERCEILFSPVSGQLNPTILAENILQDQLPVRFQLQLHKLLWQDARGK